MPANDPTQTGNSALAAFLDNVKLILGVALIGCATGMIADAFVVGESLRRPIAIGASGSVFFIGLRFMDGRR